MPDPSPSFVERLRARFEQKLASITEAHGEVVAEVPVEHWLEVARALRDESAFHFEQAVDLAGIDYLSYGQGEWDTTGESAKGFSRGVMGAGAGRFTWAQRPQGVKAENRFAVVLQLLSMQHNRRLTLRCFASDDHLPMVPSLVDVWPGLNWFEREAFDLFGIVFEGHPDLRRILTDYGFVGHPFRKDFPLIGNVEVRYDPEQGRVVYEPVSIEPRVGVPRVVRHDSRYEQARAEGPAPRS